RLRARHDAGIVDDDVEGRVARQEALRERVNVLQRAELELLDLDLLAPRRRANPLRDRFALRHVTGGENHVGASLGEDAGRLPPLRALPAPAAPRRLLAARVDPLGAPPRGRPGPDPRRVTHGDPPPRPSMSRPPGKDNGLAACPEGGGERGRPSTKKPPPP